MSDLSAVLGWQFSLGFAIGLVAGGSLVMRAVALTRRDAVPVGYRGYTPPNAGRRILPQGGSGTAKPRRTFVDDNGKVCVLPDGWSSNYPPPQDADTGEYPAVR